MILLLSVLRCPDDAAPETRRLIGGDHVLGRAEGCDWALRDPAGILSRRHCVLEFRAGAWQVRDLSTNGTFLNSAATPIGHDATARLSDGDRLRLGAYEIEVRLEAAAQGLPASGHTLAPDPFADPFPSALPDAWGEGWPGRAAGLSPFPGSLPEPGMPDPGPTRPDHASHLHDALPSPPPAPGRTGPFLLPEDDFLFAPAVPPTPQPPPGPPPLPPAAVAGPPAATSPAEAEAALRAFLRGAGLEPPPGADPTALLETAGRLTRAAVEGMRALLIARADVKRAFRIEQTMLRARDNNPVKFAASTTTALADLLAQPQRGPEALRETVADLALHQVAHLAATQAAARALLERLAPAALEQAMPGGAGVLPGLREKRLWGAYRAAHQQMTARFEDDFDSIFGRAFARAYEDAAAKAGRPATPE